jgi:hypothetical protein
VHNFLELILGWVDADFFQFGFDATGASKFAGDEFSGAPDQFRGNRLKR